MAAEDNHVPAMEHLISNGARIDAGDKFGQTPLFYAAVKGSVEAAICLIGRGADVNAPDNRRVTALMIAAQEGHPKAVEVLLESGAEVNCLDLMRKSPLHTASQNGHLSVVKILVKRGADIHQETNIGQMPLHFATFNGHNEVVNYLIKKGADFDDQGNGLGTACKGCGAADIPVFKCKGCEVVVWYCSPECQKKDWKEGGENKHKIQCPRIKEQRELYKERKKEDAKKEIERIDEEVKRGER